MIPEIPGIDLAGPISRAFHLISSAYGWDDEVILNKTLRRIRQIIAVISEERLAATKETRLIASWQTRSLAMVMAGAGGNANEEIMKFAANLTIDNEEYAIFNEGVNAPIPKSTTKVPVNANTQDAQVKRNFNAAADRNSSEILAIFGQKLEEGKPG